VLFLLALLCPSRQEGWGSELPEASADPGGKGWLRVLLAGIPRGLGEAFSSEGVGQAGVRPRARSQRGAGELGAEP